MVSYTNKVFVAAVIDRLFQQSDALRYIKPSPKSAIEKQAEHFDTAGIAAMHTADNFACNYDFFMLKFTGANHRQEGTP